MKCGRFLACFAASVLSALTFAGFLSIDTSAAYEGGEFMTPAEFREILGDDLVCEYFNGSEYVEAHFYYAYSDTGLYFRDSEQTDLHSYSFLKYTSALPNLSYSNTSITVRLQPKFSITDTQIINSFIGLRCQYGVSDTSYNPSVWDWNFNGSTIHFTSPSYEGNYRNSYIGGNNFCTIPVQISSDQVSSGYSFDVKFYGAGSSTNAQLIIGCPYISSDASVVEGTLPPDSGGGVGSGDINVSVDVDMSETNGILGSIWDSITGIPDLILDGLTSLFVPSSGYFEDKLAPIKAKFSWYTDVVDAFSVIKTSIASASSSDVPSLTLDLSDSDFYGADISSAGESLVLSWMVEYRSVIRGFLTAFMWLFFLWRVYCHLPSIISGSGMEVQPTDDGGVEFHLKR